MKGHPGGCPTGGLVVPYNEQSIRASLYQLVLVNRAYWGELTFDLDRIWVQRVNEGLPDFELQPAKMKTILGSVRVEIAIKKVAFKERFGSVRRGKSLLVCKELAFELCTGEGSLQPSRRRQRDK